MKKLAFMLLTLAIFAVFNYSIYEKEQIKAHGQTILLELAPVDPRSLMQGDYMRLRYAIERAIPRELALQQKPRGYLVIAPDESHVGRYVRFHNGEPLQPGEKLLHYQDNWGEIRITPDSFFFQEGHAKFYQAAKYGEFKFDSNGGHLLTGLASQDRISLPEKREQ